MATSRSGRSRTLCRRVLGLGLAGLVAVAGLALAVGAGASEDQSARDSAYAPSYAVDFTKKPAKSTEANKAKFAFGAVFSSDGSEVPDSYYDTFLGFDCKLDKKKEKRCSSPVRYKVADGKHKLKVTLINTNTGEDESDPAVAKWKVRP